MLIGKSKKNTKGAYETIFDSENFSLTQQT